MHREALKVRIATLALGHTADQLMTRGFNYLLYPSVMWWLGPTAGTGTMILLSFLLCLATIKFYDWAKIDWLGIESLKEVREEGGQGTFTKVLSWALKHGEVVLLVVLSIYKDAFITTAYMRKGVRQYNGMGRREWCIFMASIIISNLYWSAAVNIGIIFAVQFWDTVFGWVGS